MNYQHRWANQSAIPFPLGKIVCVGRNYADHAKELNNPVPKEPLLFIKPASSACHMEEAIQLPVFDEACHYETELAILIGRQLTRATPEQAQAAIMGAGLAFDLTLRGLQQQLKDKGQPWEKAKAFDGSCPLSPFIGADRIKDWESVTYSLHSNGELRQQANSVDMLTPIPELLAYSSLFFTLMPGDIVLTGTPAGVGELNSGDQLEVDLAGLLQVSTRVI